ncbi:family 78 glycoside hydrolase catalytic domain [Maribellus sediminis]|uniref:family 78 glycoside hydrolase catalytic domain n=1 Tax=Maribellus sediminis TaxID=2696285 RepID=UPI001430CAA1|nr:family 78 glycoside hydrolase catalytic domain [Maribellus sediminis]
MKQLLLFIVLGLMASLLTNAKIHPEKLRCEYLENPFVVDDLHPHLSWINVAGDGERAQLQTACQIRVASSLQNLEQADLWLSPKLNSTRVAYQGKDLQSRQECWWQVRVWDKNGDVSAWSEPGFWRMGILNDSEWKANWIGAPWQGEETLPKPMNPNAELPAELPPPAPMLRKEFRVQKQVKSAVAFVTGLGYFELYLNGKKVGNDVLVPNQTNYGKRPGLMNQNIPLPDDFRKYKVMYVAYDVTQELSGGDNCVGGILGNGFYNPAKYWAEGYGTPRFLLQLHISYTDGTEDLIVSDETWKAGKSPILMDMVYYGEHYDARLEQPGWCSPGFDDSIWEQVTLRKAPEGELVAHTARPDKVVQQLQPVRLEKMYNGNYKVDFGEEISGWVRLKNVEGPAGHKVEIRYLSNSYSGDNSYIFSGNGKENYAARFNWFVFREVEIVNWPGILNPEQIVAEVVNTEIPETAEFETSNPMFNAINKIWKRSQMDNMHGGVASDCPHRERSPYTGDGQVACVTVMHNFDARNFYQKWIQDIIDAQLVETGYVPNGAPWQPGCGGGVAWGAAICIMPWEYYVHYGDKDMLTDSYFAMKEYIRYMEQWIDADGIMLSQRTGKDGNVLRWFNLGDWVAPGNLPPDDMVHTFYFWRCADIAAKTAAALGEKSKEVKHYDDLAKKTKEAFFKRFYNEESGTYGPAGGNIFALKMGVPPEQFSKVIAALKKDIQKNDGHLDTGIFGTQFFFEVLSENGLHDLAYEAMNKKDEPGYGRWLDLGATTTWEHWNTTGSHNHPMFGGGLVWYYRKLAGIQTDEAEPGYKHLVFKPQPVEDISFVRYSNETSYGKAGIHWQKDNSNFSMEVTIPVGAHASIYVPCESSQTIKESGVPVNENSDIQYLGWNNGYSQINAGSGIYHFTVD